MSNGYTKPKFKRDTSGEIERYALRCIDEDFPMLKKINIIYAWRDPPKYDQKRAMTIFGEARRLQPMDRDLYGIDAVVIIAARPWKEMSKRQRRKLLWHELRHFRIEHDDTMNPETDDHGRIKIHLERHDTDLGRFRDELTKFGPDTHEKLFLRDMSRLYKKSLQKETT